MNRGNSGREDLEKLLAQFVENKIRIRAFELYECRGRVGGHALEDWIKAEGEVWAAVRPREPRQRDLETPRISEQVLARETPGLHTAAA